MLKNPTILYDPMLCTGCRGCQVACKQWNDLQGESSGWFEGPSYTSPKWISANTWLLLQMHEERFLDGKLVWAFTQRRCHHCQDAACVNLCPAEPKAAARDEHGIVTIDPELCIGCGTCVENCPFEAPKLAEEYEIARKCTMCIDRQRAGLRPACVTTCPTGATLFGERDEMVRIGKERAKRNKRGVLYGLSEAGGSSVLYVLPYGREYEGFPADPKPRGDVMGALPRKDAPVLGSLSAPGAVALGSVVLGLQKLAERKTEVRREEKP
jgi:formate dehydrogenase iron-sulfur subunit